MGVVHRGANINIKYACRKYFIRARASPNPINRFLSTDQIKPTVLRVFQERWQIGTTTFTWPSWRSKLNAMTVSVHCIFVKRPCHFMPILFSIRTHTPPPCTRAVAGMAWSRNGRGYEESSHAEHGDETGGTQPFLSWLQEHHWHTPCLMEGDFIH